MQEELLRRQESERLRVHTMMEGEKQVSGFNFPTNFNSFGELFERATLDHKHKEDSSGKETALPSGVFSKETFVQPAEDQDSTV